ncbi:hypothetical protein L2E82_02037 [Cichorium intybus]|uniref:Uncharacterized protein n=1 Tax=Cichorium intybus TaxID=13427 RepID=A0ACB9H246_CICIN|nr:hypothetical protein L2E82_02037 [Cichorium intybus]
MPLFVGNFIMPCSVDATMPKYSAAGLPRMMLCSDGARTTISRQGAQICPPFPWQLTETMFEHDVCCAATIDVHAVDDDVSDAGLDNKWVISVPSVWLSVPTGK